jgi:predicted permease
MSNFLLIVFYISLGYLFQYIKLPLPTLAYKLNKFVIYFSLPAMILLTMPTLELSGEALIPIGISWGVMAISALLVLGISKYMQFSKEVTGSLMLVSVLTNSSFVGIPIISAYLGNEALPFILIYDQLGTFLALATYGTFVGVYYSNQGKLNLKLILVKLIKFPPFIFLIMSLFLKDIEFHHNIVSILELLALTIVPFALIAVGLQLQFKIPKSELVPFSISLIIKLILAPIIAISISTLFGWEGLSVEVSILEAAMPPMITAAAVASMLGLAPRLSNAIVGYGILISFFTSYIIYAFIH